MMKITKSLLIFTLVLQGFSIYATNNNDETLKELSAKAFAKKLLADRDIELGESIQHYWKTKVPKETKNALTRDLHTLVQKHIAYLYYLKYKAEPNLENSGIGFSIQELLDHRGEEWIKDQIQGTVLNLKNLNINDLDGLNNVFKINNVKNNISIIYLQNNLIEIIKTNSFANCSEVYIVKLSNNKISKIEKDAFKGLDQNIGCMIYLNNNNLKIIEHAAFSGIIVNTLKLNNNKELEEFGRAQLEGWLNIQKKWNAWIYFTETKVSEKCIKQLTEMSKNMQTTIGKKIIIQK